MEEVEIRRNYYAILPADVRYDKKIPDGAKLLYSEITALASEKGYCWAKNEYFAELYEKSERTISRWIEKLEEYGYIIREFRYKDKSKEIKERFIKIANSVINSENDEENDKTHDEENDVVGGDKNDNTCRQKCLLGGDKNVRDNIKYINNKKERKKGKKTFDEIIENYTENENLRNELKEHLKVRKTKRAALTDHAIELSLKRLSQIASTDTEKIQVVQNAIMSGWTSFYPLQNNSKTKEASKVVKTEIDPELLARRNGYG